MWWVLGWILLISLLYVVGVGVISVFFYMGIYIHEIDTSLLKLTLLMRRKINIHYKE